MVHPRRRSHRYSFLTKSAKIKLNYCSVITAYCYSFLTKSAKIKQEDFFEDDTISYSFLTKSAKIKLSEQWIDKEKAIVSLQNRLK